MKLIVGIGNPGQKYDRTRHNAGFEVLDRMARRWAPGTVARSRFKASTIESLDGDEKVLLMKPTTYVNRTGESVAEAVRFFKLTPAEDLLVIVDDVALPCGTIRLREEGGSGGHNGLTNIRQHVGGEQWSRLRLGIDAPHPNQPLEDYVLDRFNSEQQDTMDGTYERAVDAAACWIHEGVTAAMNKYNTG
jgi:PTH1 family peptidyl-tRNA hydrolase